MPAWQGRSKATPLGYRIFVGVMKRFGVRPAYVLLKPVAFCYVLLSFSSSKAIYCYFRRLGYARLAACCGLYRNYYCFGQTLIDKVAVMAAVPANFSFDFDGEHHLREMVLQGRGGLLVSAHLGNWEIAGHLLKRLNTAVNVVMYDGEHEKIKKYLDEVTGGRNMKVIVIKNDLSHIYAISDALQNNELVCMHADRFIAGNQTFSVPFLGAQARFPVGPFLLAAQLKVPVSFVFAFKESASHYHFYASAPASLPAMPKKEQMRYLLLQYTTEIQEKLKKYPEQWFNYYDFWKA